MSLGCEIEEKGVQSPGGNSFLYYKVMTTSWKHWSVCAGSCWTNKHVRLLGTNNNNNKLYPTKTARPGL